MNISRESLDAVALSEQEYHLIVEQLGREPNEVELGMFGSLWSEHCGYKHSRPLLKLLPSRGKRVVVGPGEENAGAVDIGDGMVAVIKIESHNHPSAIDPFQGAATAIGGVVRDIFTMGARPVALLNSLRFGPPAESNNRRLLNGVVGGLAHYGNVLQVPGVGGEVFFSDSYSGNPLVNGLCLGICRKDRLVRARASGAGNLLMLVGAATGRDGIHGASGLASRGFEGEPGTGSTVPAGDPALEKLLIEACLELAQTDWIVGMQDLGAAGLTSSVVESAARGEGGAEIDVLRVPRSEEGMIPYEVMLSESQERMLLCVRADRANEVAAVLERWGLDFHVIGRVDDGGVIVVREGDDVVAQVPVDLLVTPPLYHRRSKRPVWLDELQSLDLDGLPDVKPRHCNSVLLRLLAAPNIAGKECVYRHYDYRALGNTVLPPGGDAAVLRIEATTRGVSLAVDGNGRYCYADPFVGGAIAVAEAARNLVCSGAEPVAMTDCLNFGNPERPDVYYQLRECIKGMARACRELRVPVISGNVSLYNESRGQAIYPTPVVGMLGTLDDVERHCSTGFRKEGDLVFLLGASPGLAGSARAANIGGLGASEYLEVVHGLVRGRPGIDLDMERRVQRCCLAAIRQGLLRSAHDCSDGGLLVAIAESCICGGVGLKGEDWKPHGRLDAAFFGEHQSRVVVSVSGDGAPRLRETARKWLVPLTLLGRVCGRRIVFKGYFDLPLARVEKAWRDGLAQSMNREGH